MSEIERRVVSCRRCPRLVEWRERVAREKRAAFRDEDYWGRPVPGLGPADARIADACIADVACIARSRICEVLPVIHHDRS